ncbi:MAG: NTP transferase domain-containing protein [Alphaproteobacteria bacterium]
MKFGPVPTRDAAGAILAHSQRAGGKTLKKGRVLSAEDVDLLTAAAVEEVTVARLEPGDVEEDTAAARVAAAACGAGLSAGAAFTGRTNLFAETAGVVLVDEDRIDRLNLVDEAITIATLRNYELARARQLVATIKVIPFAASAEVVDRCAEIAGHGGPLLRLAPLRGRRVGLVQTRLPGTKETTLDKTTTVTGDRLAALGCELGAELRCPHEAEALAAAIRTLRAQGCELLLINGASAIVDRRDVIPAAIESCGGMVEHYGMPVDPGNLILTASLEGVPVLGLPGCARSPKLNGVDWVLHRLLADLPLGPREIMRMGAGGLLTETGIRPLPRAEARPMAATAATAAPRIAAVVLAGGQSRRMGRTNKLLAEVDGKPMLARVVDSALMAHVDPVIVVTGHEAERVWAALADRQVSFVHNPAYDRGLSTSLRTGISAVPESCDGALVALGDMPRITPGHLDRLVAAFNPAEGRAICVPTWQGKRGNPVLWARRFFEEMHDLSGDVGAKHLIGEYEELVAEVAMDDDAVLVDIDSPDALTELRLRDGA